MSLWKIAWRSIQQRGLASALTMLSMALGVMMVIAVLTIHGVVTESFRTNSSLGYNMIVGAKGGKLQLTLNTVYLLSQPVENIPYDYYLEFKNRATREAAFEDSLATAQHEAQAAAMAIAAAQDDLTGAGSFLPLAQAVGERALNRAATLAVDQQRDGQFAIFTQLAIPLCLGDYYDKYRVVGTTPELFDKLEFDPARHRKFEFADGRNFEEYNAEHGYFEAVLGSAVARELKLELGAKLDPAHGSPEGHTHGQEFTVVGIMKPTGTPYDRGVFVNMEGFYLMAGHEKPLEKGTEEEEVSNSPAAPDRKTAAQAKPERLVTEKREVTAILVRTINPLVTPGLQNAINEGSIAQAVLPIQEIYNLLEFIVVPIQQLLLALTAMICVVSGISILVSIYNSMSERRRDIAVMRALGASRWKVGSIILFESIILSVGGGLLGTLGGHTLNVFASQTIEDRTGVTVGFLTFARGPLLSTLLNTSAERLPWNPEISFEVLVIVAVMLLAVVVGFWPAISAYRTDVSKSLAP
ncbi:MAG TPA: ABC transporter permease [Pirellulaceae bacterium]|nr:ABC transporter permease [Pirellulaceae bacterium]